MEPTRRCPHCAEEILAAAIKCKHCQSDIGPSVGKPTVPQTPKPSLADRPAFKASQIIVGVILAVWFIFRTHSSEQSGSAMPASEVTPEVKPQPPPELPKLSSTVKTNGLIVLIQNDDDFPWKDCYASINQGLLSGFDFNFGSVEAKASVSLASTQFANGSERFNPSTTKVLSVLIECTTRNGKQFSVGRFE